VRLTLVANTDSGGATDVDAVAAALRRHGAEVSVIDIEHAPRAADDGTQRIAVAGGDGSIATVARVAGDAGVALAVIPTGTANDFARALDLPADLDAACALAADPGARTTAIELACAGERPFVNAASTGLPVVAARRAAPLKPKLGPLAYAVGAVRAGLTGRPIAVRASVDGELVHDGPAWQVIVGATGAFGGGSGIAQADPHDGLLDLVVVTAGSRVALVRRAYGLRTGRIADQRGVSHRRGRLIDIETPEGAEWNVDGELCRLHPTSFSARSDAVTIVVR
jgi:YegS/Rv2252/BmrU family lipid kinase